MIFWILFRILQYPENYVAPKPAEKKTNKKSKQGDQLNNNNEETKGESPLVKDDCEHPSKKVKLFYEIESEGNKLIAADKVNKKYWDDCKNVLDQGKKVCFNFNFNILFLL